MRLPRVASARERTHGEESLEVARWRTAARPRTLRAVLAATVDTAWSPVLLQFLVEELYVGEELERLLGSTVRDIPQHRYPQVVALALMLRHSWRPDDLDYVVRRLRLRQDGGDLHKSNP